MQINISSSLIFQLLAVTASLIAAIVLLSYSSQIKNQRIAIRLLSLMFFSIFLWISLNIIASIEQFEHFFVFIRPEFLVLVLMSFFVPIHYLHINLLINKKLKAYDIFIHFTLTCVILALGVINYSNKSINSLIEPVTVLVYLQMGFYWFIELNITLRILYLKKQKKIKVLKGWFKWVKFYIMILPFIFVPFFIFKISGYSTQDSFLINFMESLGILIISLSLFFRPDFLFDLLPAPIEKKWLKSDINTKIQIENDKYKRLEKQLETYLNKHKPHLGEYFNIEQMAKELGVTSTELHSYFREKEGLSFEDYINQQRIIYSQSIIKKGAISKLTLDILAKKSGFKNRTTFINSFKEFTGYNAIDYISHFLKFPSNK
ncbi:helix-turn-helix transcriptional regulator [Echinicola salinicaeni]|uniref:helix-turn-helix transcriptional regulator n=1 Tax=Echinicola salinicaeni TaxID=2762757 RepID=UPI0016472F1D|nr:helix-turn-helix domain-containing protein [Echinicola salinicaeni]